MALCSDLRATMARAGGGYITYNTRSNFRPTLDIPCSHNITDSISSSQDNSITNSRTVLQGPEGTQWSVDCNHKWTLSNGKVHGD